MWEKSVLKACGHILVFSFLWDTFGEEIKKPKPHTHRWGEKIVQMWTYDPQRAEGKKCTIHIFAFVSLTTSYD